MRSIMITMFPYIFFHITSDPNADEFGKAWDFRSCIYNMYWLLFKGLEVFIITGGVNTHHRAKINIAPGWTLIPRITHHRQ